MPAPQLPADERIADGAPFGPYRWRIALPEGETVPASKVRTRLEDAAAERFARHLSRLSDWDRQITVLLLTQAGALTARRKFGDPADGTERSLIRASELERCDRADIAFIADSIEQDADIRPECDNFGAVVSALRAAATHRRRR
jgi:hypothetical protein